MNDPIQPRPDLIGRRTLIMGASAASALMAAASMAEGASSSRGSVPTQPRSGGNSSGGRGAVPAEPRVRGSFELAPLPYAQDALAPHISGQTLSFHYGKHHKGYVDKLNELTASSDLASKSLEDVMKAAAADASKTAVFNNAAQSWNHSFYWKSLKPGGGGNPTGKLLEAVQKDFGGADKLKQALADACATQFGSGWAWLVSTNGKLEVVKTSNAGNPMLEGKKPLLVIDVWEHAYYLDYQNLRKNYVAAVLDHLVNWDFAAGNM